MSFDTMDVCVADGGLINPTAFPCKSSDLDTEVIDGVATKVTAIGTSVVDAAGSAQTSWSKIQSPGVFETPEKEAVYALMTPAVTDAATMSAVTTRVGTAISTYAAELATIKTTLSSFEERAASFRTEALAGYEVDNWTSRGFFENFETGIDGNPVPKADAYETSHIPWTEHGPAVEKNKALLEEYNGILATISAAATTCANAIQGELTTKCVPAYVPLTEEAMNATPEFSMGWGQAVEEDRNCTESVGHGLGNFWHSTWTGAASLVGRDPNSEGWGDWSWSTFGQSWTGVGDFLFSTVIVTSVPAWVIASQNSDFNDFMNDRTDVAAGAWGSIIAWDQQAFRAGENGFHKWEEDGIAALTESVANVGTFFIPVAGWAGGGARTVIAGTRAGSFVVKVGTKVAEIAIPGGSHLIAGITRLADIGLTAGKHGWQGLIDGIKPVDVTPSPAPGIISTAVDDPHISQHPGGTHPGEIPNAALPEGPLRPPTDLPAGHGPGDLPDLGGTTPDSTPPGNHNGGHADGDVPTQGAPDGGPTQDRYGRDYEFDDDGHRHIDGDPENTYRDPSGSLHDADTGKYTADPNKPDGSGLPTERAEKGETDRNVDVTSEARAEHDRLAQERADAKAASDAAQARLTDLAERAGIDPSVFSRSTDEVNAAIQKLNESGKISDRQVADFKQAADDARTGMQDLRDASETLGDHAAESVSEARGETSIVDTDKARAGQVDHAAIDGGPPPVLTIYEAKGGSAGLGSRVIDGVRYEQGTAPYLQYMLENDARIAQGLRDYAARPDADPAIVQAIRDGSLVVRFDLVQGRPNGTIDVTPFAIDPSQVTMPPIQ